MSIQITRQDLARMFPRALPDWFDAMLRLAPSLMVFYGFNRLDWCGICGQIDAECDGMALRKMEENMHFNAARMLDVYSKRLGDCVGRRIPPLEGRVFSSKVALAQALAGKPEALADCVYGGPFGREGTPPWQGSRFIGRGPLQETHLNNYKAARDEICRQPGGRDCPDLLTHPELLATDPELGIRDVFAQWHLKQLSRYAQRQQWTVLSDVLNTGNPNDGVKPHGLPRRLRATAKALGIWPGPLETLPADEISGVAQAKGLRVGDKGESVKRLQARLNELGFHVGATDGTFGTLTKRAVVAFQAEHELVADGIVGTRTWDVLNAAAVPDLGARATVTAQQLAAEGAETIVITQKANWWLRLTKAGGVGGIIDQYFDLGVVDGAVAKAEQAKALALRGAELTSGIPARGILAMMPPASVFVFVGAVLLGVILQRLFTRIEQRGVAAARKGADLSVAVPT